MADICTKPKPFKNWRLTDDEYERVLLPKIINSWSDKRLSALYKIIVLGEKQSDIAKDLSVSRSTINKMVKTAYGIYRDSVVTTLIIGR